MPPIRIYNWRRAFHAGPVHAVQNESALSPLLHTLEAHYDGLVDYVRRRFAERHGDRSFAREVVHDVCVQLIERPPGQAVQTPLAYLRRATANQAVDKRRADAHRLALFEPVDELPDTHAHCEDGASALAFVQNLRALERTIAALPPRARQVFLLQRIHGLPQAHIASELGISRNMVAQHFARAMAAIQAEWPPADGHHNRLGTQSDMAADWQETPCPPCALQDQDAVWGAVR